MADKTKTKEPTHSLEDQARHALEAANNTGSDTLYELIEDVVAKASTLEKRSRELAQKAADPLQSTDGRATHQESEAARIDAARYRTLEQRLRSLLERTLQRETAERWNADYQRCRTVRDQASAKLQRAFAMIQEVSDAFIEAKRADELIGELHAKAPVGEVKRLGLTECHARGLECLSRDMPSIMLRCVLYLDGPHPLWPPRSSIDPASVGIPAPMYDQRFSADWWKPAHQERQRQAEIDQQELDRAQREKDQFYGRANGYDPA